MNNRIKMFITIIKGDKNEEIKFDIVFDTDVVDVRV